MADEKTPFGGSGHVIPRRESSGGEVILPQYIEGEALDLLREIRDQLKVLTANTAKLVTAHGEDPVFDTGDA